jgi:hypothetical protein
MKTPNEKWMLGQSLDNQVWLGTAWHGLGVGVGVGMGVQCATAARRIMRRTTCDLTLRR